MNMNRLYKKSKRKKKLNKYFGLLFAMLEKILKFLVVFLLDKKTRIGIKLLLIYLCRYSLKSRSPKPMVLLKVQSRIVLEFTIHFPDDILS